MVEETKNKAGAPQGNQNARKHGFYSGVLDETQRRDFEEATEVEGLDNEIALFRVKIKSLVRSDPENIKLLVRAVDSMARLIRIKFDIGKNDKTGLKDAIGNILKDVALPVGISIANILKKG
ncbi:MAG: hypothetical protein Q7R50_05870 [Dehalococcoidales bacterium]|nr:hypothetical protein [Dehalococcoidales bacterium]